VLCGVGGYLVAIIFLLLAMRTVEADESGRLERARAAGEAI
jgi:hypothetical protein